MFVLAENDLTGQLQRDFNLQGKGVVSKLACTSVNISKHRPFILALYQIVNAQTVWTDVVGETYSGPCFCVAL